MRRYFIAVITPALLETAEQQLAFDAQQFFLREVAIPTGVYFKQFICGNTPYANVTCSYNDQVHRRRVLTDAAMDWLESHAEPDDAMLLQWLDADDVPTAYWFHGLKRCQKPLNVLAVAERTLVTFTRQYIFAGKEAFRRLAQGACGVGCGSAICWRVDLLYNKAFLHPHFTLRDRLYQKYCGIEDVVLGVEVARAYPDLIGYVTADCCTDECGQGLPVVYRNPSHKLGVDKRQERNKLLAAYRKERDTTIQGCDISGGYGEPIN